MLESFFSGLYTGGTDPISLPVFLTLILSALVIGAEGEGIAELTRRGPQTLMLPG